MEQKYIDIANKYNIDITESRLEDLGAIEIKSGKMRVSDCCYDIKNHDKAKTINVQNGRWKAKSIVNFNEFYFTRLANDIIEVQPLVNKVKTDYFIAQKNIFENISDQNAVDFIISKLKKQEREELNNFDFRDFNRAERDIKEALFVSTKGIVLVHEDYCDMKEFNTGELLASPYETVTGISVDTGSLGFFDFDYFSSNQPKEEYFSDVYYGATTIEPCILERLGKTRKCQAEAVDSEGVVTKSGYGDGNYQISVLRNNKGEVVFIHCFFIRQ